MAVDILFACIILLVTLSFAKKTKWVVWTGSVISVLIIVQVVLLPFHIL